MAVNFPQLVYLPAYQVFARPVTITPVASQPGAPPYAARAGNAGGQVPLRLRRLVPSRFVGGSLVLRAPTFGRPPLETRPHGVGAAGSIAH